MDKLTPDQHRALETLVDGDSRNNSIDVGINYGPLKSRYNSLKPDLKRSVKHTAIGAGVWLGAYIFLPDLPIYIDNFVSLAGLAYAVLNGKDVYKLMKDNAKKLTSRV